MAAIEPGQRLSLNLDVEATWDGMEAEHFHFEDKCPVCGSPHAGSDYYGSPLDCIEDGGAFSCEECGAQFRLLDYVYARNDKEEDALIEFVGLEEEPA